MPLMTETEPNSFIQEPCELSRGGSISADVAMPTPPLSLSSAIHAWLVCIKCGLLHNCTTKGLVVIALRKHPKKT